MIYLGPPRIGENGEIIMILRHELEKNILDNSLVAPRGMVIEHITSWVYMESIGSLNRYWTELASNVVEEAIASNVVEEAIA